MGSYANVPRAAYGQSLLLDFASPPTPTSSAMTVVGTQKSNTDGVPTALTGSGRWLTQRSGVKEEQSARADAGDTRGAECAVGLISPGAPRKIARNAII
jgi:hypothetical protein